MKCHHSSLPGKRAFGQQYVLMLATVINTRFIMFGGSILFTARNTFMRPVTGNKHLSEDTSCYNFIFQW